MDFWLCRFWLWTTLVPGSGVPRLCLHQCLPPLCGTDSGDNWEGFCFRFIGANGIPSMMATLRFDFCFVCFGFGFLSFWLWLWLWVLVSGALAWEACRCTRQACRSPDGGRLGHSHAQSFSAAWQWLQDPCAPCPQLEPGAPLIHWLTGEVTILCKASTRDCMKFRSASVSFSCCKPGWSTNLYQRYANQVSSTVFAQYKV